MSSVFITLSSQRLTGIYIVTLGSDTSDYITFDKRTVTLNAARVSNPEALISNISCTPYQSIVLMSAASVLSSIFVLFFICLKSAAGYIYISN